MAITGYNIGKALQQALSLPKETTLIQITVGLDSAVEVLCRYYPDEAAMQRCAQVLAHFELVPKPGESPCWVPGSATHILGEDEA
jgi:hypothetical protein